VTTLAHHTRMGLERRSSKRARLASPVRDRGAPDATAVRSICALRDVAFRDDEVQGVAGLVSSRRLRDFRHDEPSIGVEVALDVLHLANLVVKEPSVRRFGDADVVRCVKVSSRSPMSSARERPIIVQKASLAAMMRSCKSVKTMGAILSSKARRKCCSASMRACSAARWTLLSRIEPTVHGRPSSVMATARSRPGVDYRPCEVPKDCGRSR